MQVNGYAIGRGFDLSGADLSGGDMSGADLTEAILGGTNLSNANLQGATLPNAALRHAVLVDADLSGSDLRYTDLSYTNLTSANLSSTYLHDAFIYGADLTDSDLTNAYLYRVVLENSNLTDVSLSGADLTGASLENSQLTYSSFTSATAEQWSVANSLSGVNITGTLEEFQGLVIDYSSILNGEITLTISDINLISNHDISELSASTPAEVLDTLAPLLESVKTNTSGTSIILKFDELISSDEITADQFQIFSDRKAEILSVAIDGDKVILNISSDTPIYEGDELMVSHIGDSIKDTSGNNTSIGDQDIMNISSRSLVLTPLKHKGTSANDEIVGDKQGNEIYGLNGNDWLYGLLGNDLIDGGKGKDTAQFSSRNNKIRLTTTKWQKTGDGKDRLVSIENVNGGGGKDKIIGNNAKNVLNGEAGDDYLSGGGNHDVLIGGKGNDRLIGGKGSDTMTGGSGKDTFVLKRGKGYDIIEDFSNRDKITVQGFNDNRVRIKIEGNDVLLYAKRDLLARVLDAADMEIF